MLISEITPDLDAEVAAATARFALESMCGPSLNVHPSIN